MRNGLIRCWFLGAIAALLLASCPRAEAAAYVKLDGVDGQAADKDHEGWIVLTSVSLTSFERWIAGGGRECDPTLSDIVVTKSLDSTSAALKEAACEDQPFTTVELHVHGSKPNEPYLVYHLENVLISSYSVGGSSSGGDTVPTERLSLSFTNISIDVASARHP